MYSLKSALLGAAVVVVGLGGIHSTCRGQARAELPFSTLDKIGQLGTNAYYTPVNQVVTPAGRQVELPGMRPQAIALSPNGRVLVTAGKTHNLVVLDPATGEVVQRLTLPSDKATDVTPDSVPEENLHPDRDGQISFTGLEFSPDGTRLYLANVEGNVKVFGVKHSGKVVGLFSIALPPAKAPGRGAEIPAGLAVSPDGKRLYVALNLSNRLAELDAASGQILRLWDVGFAPFGVAFANQKAYVSNWGGRRPDGQCVTGPAGHGTLVRVDPVRHIANEGSVSVIDLGQADDKSNVRSAKSEILTGAGACAIATSPNGRWVVVANAGTDTLSVIDARTDQVVETICARQNPADLFGAQPNALAFDQSGARLFVCNGSQNAEAVFDFKPGKSTLRGLIPVGWYPGAVAYDSVRKAICVANIKGIGSTKRLEPGEAVRFNSHQYFGTLSLVPVPARRELSRLTRTALQNLRYGLLQEAKLPPRRDQPPRPVPERTGEPSVIKHVI